MVISVISPQAIGDGIAVKGPSGSWLFTATSEMVIHNSTQIHNDMSWSGQDWFSAHSKLCESTAQQTFLWVKKKNVVKCNFRWSEKNFRITLQKVSVQHTTIFISPPISVHHGYKFYYWNKLINYCITIINNVVTCNVVNTLQYNHHEYTMIMGWKTNFR